MNLLITTMVCLIRNDENYLHRAAATIKFSKEYPNAKEGLHSFVLKWSINEVWNYKTDFLEISKVNLTIIGGRMA